MYDGDYENLKEGYSIFKSVSVKVIAWVLGVVILFGGVGLLWKYISTNADREIFKTSLAYNEGMLDDLAKYRFEMIKEADDSAKVAIADLVNSRFGNFDAATIENKDLLTFLEDCKNLTLEKY